MTKTTPFDELFSAAGVQGWLHARDIDSGKELEHDADAPVILASVFKIPVLLEMYAQGEAGELDVTAPVTVPVAGRTTGPFGISLMRDPISMSLRDLGWLMMGISDNAATDVITERVGVDRVNATLGRLGLDQTVLMGTCQDLFDTMLADLGADPSGSFDELDLTKPAVLDTLRALDPTATSRSTPRQVTELLSQIWTDRAGSAEVCAQVRTTLGQQVWPHRLAAGFPEDPTKTSGKTGTLPRVRNECGVVEYDDGGRYAVAVFTRSTSTTQKNPAADAVIGAAARRAVDLLRGQG